jgi:hypothetical protein
MKFDESKLADLPLETRRLVLRAIAEAAAHGITLQVATGDPVRRSEAARLAGQASARARLLRFGSANPRTNRERTVHVPVNETGTTCERIVNGSFPSNAIPLARASEISDLQISEIREDQRESAREAPPSKAAKNKAATPKAPAWRRVPPTWIPNEQHRQIASDRCVPFELELAKFRDHEFGSPKRDPDATFRNWLRSARPGPTPHSAAPLPPVNGHKIRYSTPAEIYRALGREA